MLLLLWLLVAKLRPAVPVSCSTSPETGVKVFVYSRKLSPGGRAAVCTAQGSCSPSTLWRAAGTGTRESSVCTP